MDAILPLTALALIGASAVGAAPPLFRRWSDRGLHLFVALSAGVFLGTIFFHLLPHLAGVEHGGGHDHALPGGPSTVWPWAAALGGILLLVLLERTWLRGDAAAQADNPHAVLWTATFIGLAFHAATTGVALSGVLDHPEGRVQFLASVLIHKATECFSLATVMRLAGLRTGRALLLLALFALIEPAGLLLGASLATVLPTFAPILTGFACGTFLYVAVADLLPEVFHGGGSVRTKLAAVLVGVAIPAATLERLDAALDFAIAALREGWGVFLAMAPFLLFGFALAGVVKLVLKPERVVRRIGRDDLRSIGWAALLGAPLPLCSCSVVPVAVALRRAGASKGATSAFTVSTPETGVDSIAVTWALLDPLLTIVRPIGALVSALASGAAVNWLVRRGLDADGAPSAPGATNAPAGAACCATTAPEEPPIAAADASAHASHAHASTQPKGGGFLARALRYGFVDMLDDIAPSLLVGILLSGAISAALPAGVLEGAGITGFPSLIVMLLVGIPIYVCAAASTPIAAALILKGLSPGAAFVFLMAGPATNMASLVVLAKHLGRRVVAVQVAALSVAAVALGWAVDRAYAWLALSPSASLAADHEHGTPWIAYGSAAILAALLLASLVRTHGSRDLLAPLREGAEPA